jgi:hypothetical protein
MGSEVLQSCCCGSACPTGDCLFGALVEDGCCHACDHLLLWCERPPWSTTTHGVYGNDPSTNLPCETCRVDSNAGGPPVQAIYKFDRAVYRCVFAAANEAVTLIQMPVACPDCPIPNQYTDCCSPLFPDASCQCGKFWTGIGGINTYRRAQLVANPATQWFIDMTCHKGGAALGGTASVPSLYDGFLCLVFWERWWKIAQDCPPQDHIYVPTCQQYGGGGDCNGAPFQNDDLVPRWWIFACSGVPLYDFDIDDAVRFGVIDSGEAAAMRADIANGITPSQTILRKMGEAGIIRAGDWRDEQRQAYIDLDSRFPSAGYNGCIQSVGSMHTLGPFRKRCTNGLVGAGSVNALLDAADVVPEIAGLQADCFIPYAGSLTSQGDYDYWAERQWVYFRGVPAGWQWAGWNAPNDPACAGLGLTEEEAILRGCGRGDMTCIEAFKGNPRPPDTCAPCACTEPNTSCCAGCGDCSYCGGWPLANCADDQTPIPTYCRNLAITPLCEGVMIRWAVYEYTNDLAVDPQRMYCKFNVASYLTEFKRSSDSWADLVPFACRPENPALNTFAQWPLLYANHVGHSGICNPLSQGDFSLYTAADLCCGGICYSEPCWDINGEHNDCAAHTECPPHSTQGQQSCMGGLPPCP